MEIGAQFFTLRDYCQNLTDFEESLKKVADIGYKIVQISGTCEYDAVWLDEKLKENGLKCVITHNAADKLISDTEKICEDNFRFGCKNIGLGWYPFTKDGTIDDFCEKYLPVAEKVKQSGGYFMYHNHDGEFKKIDNKPIIEHLAEKISPELMGFTLDVFWVQAGGGDPGYWLERLKGRVPCMHLKDFAYGKKMAFLGDGNINFDRIFAKAEEAGTEYMLVEQDDCYDMNPFECLERSYKYLVSKGF